MYNSYQTIYKQQKLQKKEIKYKIKYERAKEIIEALKSEMDNMKLVCEDNIKAKEVV